jgi:TonB family protein
MSFKCFLTILTSMAIASCLASSAPAQVGDQQQSPPKIIRKSGGALQSSAVTRVEPVYPPLAKAARISGVVVVEVTVDEEGNVISALAISGHPLLKDASLTAARGWKFQPTMLSGTPVKVIGTITFNFNLGASTPDSSNSDESDIEEAKKAVAANPNSGEAHYALGEAYAEEGLYQQAIESFKESVRLLHDKKEPYLRLASAYQSLGIRDQEILVYKKALEVFPNSADFLQLLSRSLRDTKRYAEAVEVQKQLIQQKPEDAEAYLELGLLHHYLMRYEEAVAAYNQAVHFRPDYGLAIHNLASAYFALRRFPDAVSAYLRVTQIKPPYNELHRVYVELGQTYMWTQRFGEALDAANKAIELRSDYAEAYVLSGAAHMFMGHFEAAVEAYKKGIGIAPTNWQLHASLGNAYLNAEQFAEAENASREAIRLGANHPSVYYVFGIALEKQKRPAEAEAVLKQGVQASPKDANMRIALASFLDRVSKSAEAEAEYNEALRSDPNNPTVLNNLGYLLVERGVRLEEALKMIQRAVDASPKNGAYLDSLGWAYFKLGKLDEAERYLTEAARWYIGSATVQEHLGDVYDRLGKKEMARTTWQKALFFSTDAKQSERLRSKASPDQKK